MVLHKHIPTKKTTIPITTFPENKPLRIFSNLIKLLKNSQHHLKRPKGPLLTPGPRILQKRSTIISNLFGPIKCPE